MNDAVAQILEDDSGDFWVGTNRGIGRMRRRELDEFVAGRLRYVHCTVFGKSEGMTEAECSGSYQPSCHKTKDGRLWFCTVGGLVCIDPTEVQRPPAAPKVYIEEIELDERHLLGDAESVLIPPGVGRVAFRYSGLDFAGADHVRFKYKLEGYDGDWVNAGNRRIGVYTRVPPGKYNFRVIAASNEGVWNEAGAVMRLEVQPQVWQTGWFMVLVLVVTAGFGVGLIWWRVRDGKRVQGLRLRIARDLHDEAGSNLGSILLLSRRAARRVEDRPELVAELAEIQRVTATTSESVRDMVWILDPEFDTLGQMLKGMENVTARLLVDVPCEAHWNVTRIQRELSLEFRSQFFLIFKEILHNIRKYARATQVKIELKEEGDILILRVQDNGVGFDPEKVSRGYGLSSLEHRAARLDGGVTIESRPGHGACISLRARFV